MTIDYAEIKRIRKDRKKRMPHKEGKLMLCDDGVEREVIYRKTAKRLGKNKFFLGKRCKKGHRCERYTNTGVCVECEKERAIEWNSKNPDKVSEIKRRYNKQPKARCQKVLRYVLKRVLTITGTEKDGRTESLLGYGHHELKSHLESRWLEGMTWDNYGEWHIDHVVPISFFVDKGEYRPDVINSLDNLTPMWAEHNLSKGDKTLEEFLEYHPHLETYYGHLVEFSKSVYEEYQKEPS